MDDLKKEFLGAYSRHFEKKSEKVEPIACTPVAATFCSTLARFSELGFSNRLDEESISGALLGAFAAAFPFCVALFSEDDDAAARCSWGQYNKSKTTAAVDSEAERGADFVLVVWTSETTARVALFQAKRANLGLLRKAMANFANVENFEPAERVTMPAPAPAPELGESIERRRWYQAFPRPAPLSIANAGLYAIDVHRRKKAKADKPQNVSQLERLVRTGGILLNAKAGLPPPGPMAPTPPDGDEPPGASSVRARLASLSFIHYLGYLWSEKPSEAPEIAAAGAEHTSEGPPRTLAAAVKATAQATHPEVLDQMICVPLEQVDHALWRDGVHRHDPTFRKNPVDLAKVNCYAFSDVLLHALAPTGIEDPFGWLTLSKAVIDKELPTLQEFGTVVMADGHGALAGFKPEYKTRFVPLKLRLRAERRKGWTPSPKG